MSTKYKVGDVVKVRQKLERDKWYKNENKTGFDEVAIDNMSSFAGKELTIMSISSNLKYVCEECPNYYWTDGMFAGYGIKKEAAYRDDTEDKTVISSSESVDLLSLYGGK